MVSPENRCVKCGGSTAPSASGRITQWVFACTCLTGDIQSPAQSQAVPTIICKSCGKRLNQERIGSFTQWVFRSDLCNCEEPQPMVTSAVTSPNLSDSVDVQEVQDALLSLPGLEVDTSKFPSDRYKPVSMIGQGATGVVYLCVDKLLKKRVAIKILHTVDSVQLVAFQQEAKTTSRLNHDNIVKVLDFGATEGGVPFMVMELVDGVSLEAAIHAEGPLEPAVAASLVRKICMGLAYAHKNGVLHRDVKSSNTLLSHTESGGVEPVIIDFGVAALKFARQEPTIISGKTIVGSPFYMPPDQALGRTYDERSEIYSVGCTLFEALTGKTPFEGAATLETIGMHAHVPPPALRDVCPNREFGSHLEAVVARCLAKDPAQRYQSCAELADDLEHLIPELLEIGKERAANEEEQESVAITPAVEQKPSSNLLLTALAAVIIIIGLAVPLILYIVNEGQSVVMPKADTDPDITTNQWKKAKAADQARQNAEKRVASNPTKTETSALTEFGKVDENIDANLSLAAARPAAQPKVQKSYLEAIDAEFDVATRGGLTKSVWGNGRTKGLIEVSATGRMFTDEDFKPLLKMNDVERIVVQQKDITGDGLKYARHLPIQSVQIRSSTIKEAAIQNITQFKQLEHLELGKVWITRDGIKQLAKMPKLRVLFLMNIMMEDDWIKDINESKSIDTISLDSCANLTDNAVKYACQNKNLKDLRFRRLNIDDKCVPYVLDAARNLKKLKYFFMIDCRGVSLPARKAIQKEMAARAIASSIYDQYEENEAP